jgi:prepilin-type N-terminal cleavage/methylation domain-containing protein
VLPLLQQQLRIWASMASSESGFSLIELLVTMLVLSILAAIALPAFGAQASKARDTRAKGTAQEAAVAIETCRLESGGLYTGCDVAALRAIDPTLPDSPTLKVNVPKAGTSYTVTVRSDPHSQKFKVKRSTKGALRFPCTKAGVAGCPAGGDWG